MSTSRNSMSEYDDELIEAIMKLAEEHNQVTYQMVVDKFTDVIAQSCNGSLVEFEAVKSRWIRSIRIAARTANVEIATDKPAWERIMEIALSKSPDSTASKRSTTPRKDKSTLKMPFTTDEKKEFERVFNLLDKNKFWYLEATKREAVRNGVQVESVEEKLRKHALESRYRHPCHSFIIDVDDRNWDNYFSKEEMDEIEDYGAPLLIPAEATVAKKLNDLKELSSPKDAYKFACCLEHDPEEEPLLAWLSMSIQQTAYQFLKKNKTPISSYLEADKQYYIWGFLNSIFHGNDNICALGKERSSTASAAANNNKRKLSSVEEITRKAMGRRMDAIYVGGGIELGAMEIGGPQDDTKDMKDGKVKLPHVMKDMLLAIVNRAPSTLRKTHITGLSINGDDVTLIDADSPNGYITRIRRTQPLSFPTCSENFVVRIIPLLELATVAMLKMENTLDVVNHTEIPLQKLRARDVVLPPSFSPPISPAPSSSVSTSSSSIAVSSSSTPTSSSSVSALSLSSPTLPPSTSNAKRQK